MHNERYRCVVYGSGGVDIEVAYFIVGLIASMFGSIAGIGGGVIMKPLLDLLGHYDVATIGVLSSACVFSMAAVTLLRSSFSGLKVDLKISSLLAIASIVGGVVGKLIFNYFLNRVENLSSISFSQSLILSLLMLLILLYTIKIRQIKHYELSHLGLIMFIGFLLGIIAAFLGIGGGPLNVAILSVLFSMNFREASINSLFIIFFSQISSLLTTQVTTGFHDYNLEVIYHIVIGGILGGFVGSSILVRIHNKYIRSIFSVGISLILLLNVFNVIKIFFWGA